MDQDGLKIVLQSLPGSNSSNINNHLSYPMQTVNSLPNGNVTTSTTTSLNVSHNNNCSIQNMVSQTYSQAGGNIQKVGNTDQVKQVSVPVIIKSNSVVSTSTGTSPITTLSGSLMNTTANSTNSPSSTIVTFTKSGANNSNVVPSSVQIVNVNNIRNANPTAGNKNVTNTPRLMIPQVFGTRTGQHTQITLQALQGLQSAQGGHLLLKTENGQYQLVRVGAVPTQSSNSGSSNSSSVPTANFRVQTIPVCTVSTTSSAAGAVVSTTTITTTTTTTIQGNVAQPQTATVAPRAAENTKDKCRKFLANLLELSSKEPKAVEKNVRTLIQELVDAKVEPEEFCDRLEKLLNASPQPCLIGFLKKSLPLLRTALSMKEMTIEGIRPPPTTTSIGGTTTPSTIMVASSALTQMNNQVRPNTLSQMRVLPQSAGVMNSINRAPGQIQHRILTVRSRLGSPVPRQPIRVATPIQTAKVMSTSALPTIATSARVQPPFTSSVSTSSGFSSTLASALTASSNEVITTIGSNSTMPANLIPSTSTGARGTAATRQPAVKTAAGAKVTAISAVKSQTPVRNNQASKSTGSGSNRKGQFLVSDQSKIAQKDKKTSSFSIPTASSAATTSSSRFIAEDDVNDVAAMAGVNLAEETQRILGSTEFVGTQIRSCKDETFLHVQPLHRRILNLASKYGLSEPSSDVVFLISHAVEERLKNIAEKLAVIAEHRIDFNKADDRYEVVHDIRGQLKMLEELDKVERKRHDEVERELLLRAAKSRSKSEDPEQVKLKAKAKEMQRAEMEELRQREANVTALLAIGPRKKLKTDAEATSPSSTSNTLGTNNSVTNRVQTMNRPRLKRVTMRDYLFLLEHEKDTCKSPFLYKAYFK